MRRLSLCLVLVALPTAQAMDLQAHSPSNLELAPDVPGAGGFDVQVSCDLQEAGTAIQRLYLNHTIEAEHPGLVASTEPRQALPEDLCLQEEPVSIPVTFEVAGGMDVPSETPWSLEHRLAIEDSAGRPVSDMETVTSRIVMEWVGRIEVEQPVKDKQAGPQKQIAYEVEISNTGNGRAVITWQALDAASVQGDVVIPSDIVLDAPNMKTGETTKTVVMLYSTPFENGDNHVMETFQAKVWAESTKNPELRSNETVLEFGATTKGVYVPGPAPIMVMAALAALAASRRRA